MSYTRTFSPAGRVDRQEETIGQKLQRLARASLPVPVIVEEGVRKRKRRYCGCGAPLHVNPKVRSGKAVCDDCAELMPPLPGGRPLSCTCAVCRAPFPRAKLKEKGNRLYCKNCLKVK